VLAAWRPRSVTVDWLRLHASADILMRARMR
jgi:hypothetical protein